MHSAFCYICLKSWAISSQVHVSKLIWRFLVKHVNTVQKFCCNGFSKFLLLYVILVPTSLWESYWCRPPLMSPGGPVHVRDLGKVLISLEKSWNWETHPQTKTIWHPWNAFHEQMWLGNTSSFIIIFGSGHFSGREVFGKSSNVTTHRISRNVAASLQ